MANPHYIGEWLLGPDLTVLNAFPAIINPDSGEFEDGAGANLLGVIRRLGNSAGTQLKNVRPCTTAQDNMIPVSYGVRCALTALKTRYNLGFYVPADTAGTAGQLLGYLRQSGSHVHLFWQEGGETFDGYFVM